MNVLLSRAARTADVLLLSHLAVLARAAVQQLVWWLAGEGRHALAGKLEVAVVAAQPEQAAQLQGSFTRWEHSCTLG
jgi:hypothetical protein